MLRQFVIAIGVLAVAGIFGCQRSGSPVAKPVSPPAVAPQPTVVAKPVEAPKSDESSEDRKTPPAPSSEPPPKLPEKTADGDQKKSASEPPKCERVAILMPGGPLVVDIALLFDGHPQVKAFDELIDRVLAAADTDKDGKRTWKELAANKEYLAAQKEKMPPTGARQLKMWTDQYDRNRDGQIDRDEAASWIGRAAGRSARAFALRSSRSYFSVPSAGSRIWKLLDADGDEQLSAAELEHCAATLASLDDNDDGILIADEITSLREQLQVDGNQVAAVSRAANPYAAIHLESDFERDRLQYLLSDLYAPQQDLGPNSFPALAEVYRPLDANGDDWLDEDELAKLLTVKPHLKLTVDFRAAGPKGKGGAVLTVGEHIPGISVDAQPGADRVVVWLGKTRLIVSANDLATGETAEQAAAASQIRLMVHDECDALFEALDANADGRLGEREIATGAKRLLERDANKDGVLNNDELPYSMIVAFLRGEAPGEQSFYHPPSEPASPTLSDTPAWFVHADFNADGDVSRREFLGSIEQFSLLDVDRDNYISAAEAERATAATLPAKNP